MSVTASADLMDYDDVLARFDPVLGLEVHVVYVDPISPWSLPSSIA